MINVKITRFEDGSISGFTVKGHAGYAEAGQDIICAAVSAICYTAAGYFETVKPENRKVFFEEKDGYMKLLIEEPGTPEDKAAGAAVMEAWYIGIAQVRESYGRKYLRITDIQTGGSDHVKN